MLSEIPEREIESDTSKMSAQKRGKTHNKPFFEIERLKKNFLCQLESFAEWLKDLNRRFTAVHTTI